MSLLEKMTCNSGIRFKLGPLVDLETIVACENMRRSLRNKVEIHGYKKSEKLNINVDKSLNYRANNINEKIENYSILEIWNNLLDQKKLFGYESQKDFYHLTDLDIFKKLKDL